MEITKSVNLFPLLEVKHWVTQELIHIMTFSIYLLPCRPYPLNSSSKFCLYMMQIKKRIWSNLSKVDWMTEDLCCKVEWYWSWNERFLGKYSVNFSDSSNVESINTVRHFIVSGELSLIYWVLLFADYVSQKLLCCLFVWAHWSPKVTQMRHNVRANWKISWIRLAY